MTVRVTAAEVSAIMDDVTRTSDVIESFITGADDLVTNVLGTSSLSATALKEITRWLSAHMIASTLERMGIQEGAGGASIRYMGEYKQNLSSTPYGQMVLMLDTTGLLLASSSGKLPASIFAVPSFD